MAAIEVLRLDGVTVAMLFAFESGGVTYLYNSGFEPASSGLAVGLLSKAVSIREAIGRGCREFDFLRGDEEYKYRFGAVDRPIYHLKLQRPA